MVTFVVKDIHNNEVIAQVPNQTYCAMFKEDKEDYSQIIHFCGSTILLPKGTIKRIIGKEPIQKELYYLD